MGLIILEFLLFVGSFFMMLLILVQRGKGGGLTGALGGMGGQSAFGAKAGDVFTKVTVVTAIIWICLCMVTIAAYNPPPRPSQADSSPPSMTSGSEENTEETKDDDLMEQIIKDQKELNQTTDPADKKDQENLKQEIQKDEQEIEGKSNPPAADATKNAAGPDLNAPETKADSEGQQDKSSDEDSSTNNGQ